jgi:hypothetical protein
LQELTATELDQITAQERNHCLGERVLADLHRRYPPPYPANDRRPLRAAE